MTIDVLTLFPGMFVGPLDESIVRRARDAGHLDLRIHNLRDYAHDRHRTVDDRPFGGGPGMLLKPEPLFEAVEKLGGAEARVILLDPAGRPFDQALARELAGERRLLLICGSYEGVDERARSALVDDEVSIGDYVLTNGALPAMVVIDAVTRLLPGVLGDDESAHDESFSRGWLEYPQYTRPAEFRGMKVPEILLSGHHAEIAKWRREQAQQRTAQRRPDLAGANAAPPDAAVGRPQRATDEDERRESSI
ncbi:MAG: tRNA (guanosine(37)-N1)-methyltransferase TrmD [Verrucomicrobia bacterium]|nr:tRNA (guanosine(37)-N1)-methyltransferase TrmD [Verrucomicrobiota bacterium]